MSAPERPKRSRRASHIASGVSSSTVRPSRVRVNSAGPISTVARSGVWRLAYYRLYLKIKIDAIPGRVNETWFRATREGTYYGQCSELCGKDHAYMPIAVRVVSDKDYAAWIDAAKKKYASTDTPRATTLAAAE